MSSPRRRSLSDRVDGAPTATPRWRDLQELDQQMLWLAHAESRLGMVLPALALERSGDGASVAGGDVRQGPLRDQLRMVAVRLVAAELIWFYRVADGYPDLPADAVRDLCRDDTLWDPDNDASHDIGLYLTEAGEELLPEYRTASVVPIRPES